MVCQPVAGASGAGPSALSPVGVAVGGVRPVPALSSLGIERLPDNHSYAFRDVTGFGVGFYLWSLAIPVFCLGQAWWCWKARRADDMPGWHWLDVALIAAIAVTMYAGTQMPALHFDVDKVLMPPESSQSL